MHFLGDVFGHSKYRIPSPQITAIGQMSGKFGILTGESLDWPDKFTRNNLKQNLQFYSVGYRWDYTVTSHGTKHKTQCTMGESFCGIVNDKTVYITIITHIKIKLSGQIFPGLTNDLLKKENFLQAWNTIAPILH